ncbi:MAG: hypothetical protein OEZ22_13000 [Spirochaetia bacterium]|nr:hypothetical protein [Spirochaetia bacterium]
MKKTRYLINMVKLLILFIISTGILQASTLINYNVNTLNDIYIAQTEIENEKSDKPLSENNDENTAISKTNTDESLKVIFGLAFSTYQSEKDDMMNFGIYYEFLYYPVFSSYGNFTYGSHSKLNSNFIRMPVLPIIALLALLGGGGGGGSSGGNILPILFSEGIAFHIRPSGTLDFSPYLGTNFSFAVSGPLNRGLNIGFEGGIKLHIIASKNFLFIINGGFYKSWFYGEKEIQEPVTDITDYAGNPVMMTSYDVIKYNTTGFQGSFSLSWLF